MTKDVVCCAEYGPEENAFPAQGDGTVNEGLLGVDLNHQFSVVHDPESIGFVHAAILAMKTGDPTPFPYFGAAEISLWEDRPDLGALPIVWSDPNGPNRAINTALLTDSGPFVCFDAIPNDAKRSSSKRRSRDDALLAAVVKPEYWNGSIGQEIV
ncbi:MAG: hypothetical protein ABIV13_04910 [Fimbriimonadales bacterium]